MENSFSVLMSVYYKENYKFLNEALESIIENQEEKPSEIVLIKDGKLGKDLEKVIKNYELRYPNLFKIISFEKNEGLGKALNVGLKNCKYDLVARMDADDIAKKDRFKKQLEIFKKNKEIDIVGSWVQEFEEKKGNIVLKNERRVPEKNDEIYLKLKRICAFNHPTVMYKKSKIIQVGSYLQDFLLEDYYLWIRLAIDGAKMYNIQESLLLFRITLDTPKRRGGIRLLKSDIKFQKKLYELKFLTLEECMMNIIVYGLYRIIPARIRGFLQKKFLRTDLKRKK